MHAATRRMRLFVRLLLPLVVALAMPGGVAVAHVALVVSEPAHDSAYERAPARLRLEFTDAVTQVALRLRDASGRVFDLPVSPRIDGTTIEAELPADLPNAIYVLRWRVTAADSHPAGGVIVFAVATEIPAGFVPGGAGGSDVHWQIANGALRFIVTACVLFAAGTVMFGMLVAPVDTPHRRTTGRIAMIGAAAALVAIPARGALLLDPEDLDVASAWCAGTGASLAASMAVAAIGLAAIAAAWTRATPPRLVAALGAETALVSYALSGHVATVEPRWLTASIIVLHVAIAAYWLGALAPLGVHLRDRPLQAAAMLRRFSRIAIAGVGALVVLGATMAVIQVADPQAIGTTSYGLVLALKLVAFVALLTIAAGNRLMHTPALARGDVAAAHRLRRAIAWEAAAFAGVLLATSTLSLTPPPRSTVLAVQEAHAHAPQVEGVAATATAGRVSAVVEILPGRVGPNRVLVEILDPDGRAIRARALIVELVQAAGDGSAIRRLRPAPRGEGGYAAENVDLPTSGRWLIRLEIAPNDSESETLTTEVTIR